MPDEALTARDSRHDPDGFAAAELGVDAALGTDIFTVHVDVDQRAQLAAPVEEHVPDRESPERRSDRRRVQLERLLAARLVGEQAGQENGYSHSATSTESTAGRCRAASIHSSPSFGETKTEPLLVPK